MADDVHPENGSISFAQARSSSDSLLEPAQVAQSPAQAGGGPPDAIEWQRPLRKLPLETPDDLHAREALLEARLDAAESDGEQIELLLALARLYESRLGDLTSARHRYRAVLEVDPTHEGALTALRLLSLELDDVIEAARLLDREQRLATSPEARAALLVELAVLRRDRLDDPHGARCAFEEAYGLDKDNEEALLAVAEGKVERCEWSVVTGLLDRLARTAPDRPASEQQRIFANLGRARLAKGDAARALDAFRRATRLGATDVAVLRGLVECAVAQGEPEEALLAQRRLLEVLPESEHAARADAFHRLGALHAELGDERRARFAWENALEIEPGHRGSFRALDAILLARGEDEARERAHLAMISRAQATRESAFEFELWHALGDMRRARADTIGSLEAFRAASLLRPDDSHERRIVAELYAATDQTELAIAEILAAIDREPLEAAHHKALYSLFTRTGDLDRAFCVAAVLCFLKAADGEQRACFAELRPKGVPHFRSALTRAVTLRSLVHPDLDRDLSTLFGLVARAARTLKGRSTRLPPYAGAAREDPRSTGRIAAKAFFGAANVLGIPAPELLVRQELPTLLHALPIESPTSLMGAGALSGLSVPELFFVCGKHLLAQHGEHGVRAAFPGASELAALRDAIIEAVCPGTFPVEVRRTADVLVRELTRPEGVELKKTIESAPGVQHADIDRWMRGSELTALRAGLLLCGDLSVAAKIVRQEAVIPGDPSPNEKVKELVRFAVSDDYHVLRSALGIATSRRVPDDDDEPTIERKLCA